MSSPTPMTSATADVLFGAPPPVPDFDHDLYEMRKLADAIFTALAAVPAVEAFAFVGAELAAEFGADPQDFEWTMPFPDWVVPA